MISLRKFFYFLFLSFFVSLSLVSETFSQTDSKTERIAELALRGLDRYNGMYATVIYGIGSGLTLGNNSLPVLNYLQLQTSAQKIQRGLVKTSAVELEKRGIKQAYNYILVVVHEQPRFAYVTAKGNLPKGDFETSDIRLGNTAFKKIFSITRKEYLTFYAQQNGPETLVLQLLE